MVEVPLTNDPAQRFETELNGIRLFFTVRYNSGGAFWTLDLADSDGAIVAGVVMLTGRNLLDAYRGLKRRFGGFWMWDKSGLGNNAQSTNLGTEVVMLYFLPGEEVPLPFIPYDEIEPLIFNASSGF